MILSAAVCVCRWALGICLALTVLLVLGTKESSNFNLWTTILHVALVLFIIIAGFTQVRCSGWSAMARA